MASSGEDPIVVSDDTDNERTTDISMATDEKESSVIDQKEECSNVDKDIEIESAIEEDVSEVEISNVSILKSISLE